METVRPYDVPEVDEIEGDSARKRIENLAEEYMESEEKGQLHERMNDLEKVMAFRKDVEKIFLEELEELKERVEKLEGDHD